MYKSGVILPRENQKYFLLNINEAKNGKGERSNNVDHWMKEKFAPIFFKGHTIDQLKKKDYNSIKHLHKHPHKDADEFVEIFSNTEDKIVFSIGDKTIYFFKQVNKLVPFKVNQEDGVKGFPIKILKEQKIKDCPLVLASIKANRHFSSGTFKEVKSKYSGNIHAIEYSLYHEKPAITNFSDYLKCLSSVEFETLIAKILEENGFFVPAYKGGFIKNFDLVCRNSKGIPIEIGKNIIEPGETKLIQIKLKLEQKDYKNDTEFFYFCLESKIKEKNVFVANDIGKLLEKSRTTYNWLTKSLYWAEFVKNG